MSPVSGWTNTTGVPHQYTRGSREMPISIWDTREAGITRSGKQKEDLWSTAQTSFPPSILLWWGIGNSQQVCRECTFAGDRAPANGAHTSRVPTPKMSHSILSPRHQTPWIPFPDPLHSLPLLH